MIVFARVCIAILLLCASPAFGQPEGVHLSWNRTRGGATQRSIAITWSDKQLSTGFVKYGVGTTSLKLRRAKVAFSAAMDGLAPVVADSGAPDDSPVTASADR